MSRGRRGDVAIFFGDVKRRRIIHVDAEISYLWADEAEFCKKFALFR